MSGKNSGLRIVDLKNSSEILQVLNQFDHRLESLSQGLSFRSSMAEKFGKHAVFHTLVDEDSTVIGFTAFYCNDVKTKTAFLSMIAVREGFSGLGYGSYLLDDVMRVAEKQGMDKVNLEVYKKNLSAINFYKGHGFVEYDCTNKSVFMQYNLKRNAESKIET